MGRGAILSGRVSSATEKALALVAGGMTAYRAAKTAGVALSTVYRAIGRLRLLEAANKPKD